MEDTKIRVYFNIEKPFYYPEEKITGQIFAEFYNSINFNQISFIFKGKQYVKINRNDFSHEIDEYEDSYDEDSEEENENKKGKITDIENIDKPRTIFKYQKILKIKNYGISKGKYIFPIEIDIPDNIPGSFLYIDNHIYLEILYTIKIKIDEINFKEAIPIIIRQKEKYFNYPKFNEYKKVLGECCWQRGQVSIKINPSEKYNLKGDNINLNVLINNEQSGLTGTPLNIEMYQKLIFFPKDKSKRIILTRLVGNARGKNTINPRSNYNEDISIKMDENKFLSFNMDQIKAYKYFKDKNIIKLLTPSIKSNVVICEYEIYAGSQFSGIFKEELGVFNKILLYSPEKGILDADIDDISKNFKKGLTIKKIFLNSDSKDDEIELEKNKNINKEENKDKKGKEKKDRKKKIKKNKKHNNENDEDNMDINDEESDQNIKINQYNKNNSSMKEYQKYNYSQENENTNNFKKKSGRDYIDEHELDDFNDNSSDN